MIVAITPKMTEMIVHFLLPLQYKLFTRAAFIMAMMPVGVQQKMVQSMAAAK